MKWSEHGRINKHDELTFSWIHASSMQRRLALLAAHRKCYRESINVLCEIKIKKANAKCLLPYNLIIMMVCHSQANGLKIRNACEDGSALRNNKHNQWKSGTRTLPAKTIDYDQIKFECFPAIQDILLMLLLNSNLLLASATKPEIQSKRNRLRTRDHRLMWMLWL